MELEKMKWQLREAKVAIKDGARTGKIAGAAVLTSVAIGGYIENRDAIAPLNAISHAAWGESAFDQNTLSLKYTTQIDIRKRTLKAQQIDANGRAIDIWSLKK